MDHSRVSSWAGPSPKCSRTALFVILQCCFNQLFAPFLLVLMLVSFSQPSQAAPSFSQEQASQAFTAQHQRPNIHARSVGGPGQPDLFLVVLNGGEDMYKHLAWLYGWYFPRRRDSKADAYVRRNCCERWFPFSIPGAEYVLDSLHFSISLLSFNRTILEP